MLRIIGDFGCMRCKYPWRTNSYTCLTQKQILIVKQGVQVKDTNYIIWYPGLFRHKNANLFTNSLYFLEDANCDGPNHFQWLKLSMFSCISFLANKCYPSYKKRIPYYQRKNKPFRSKCIFVNQYSNYCIPTYLYLN